MADRQPEKVPVTAAQLGSLPARLIALVDYDPSLALSVLAVLEEEGVAGTEFIRAERARLNLARGDSSALVELGMSGAELTPKHAIDLLVQAFSGASMPEAVTRRAVLFAHPLTPAMQGKLISTLRTTQDKVVAVEVFEQVSKASEEIPNADRRAWVVIGVELIGRIGTTAGEIRQRKLLTLSVLRATVTLSREQLGSALDQAFRLGAVRSYDVATDAIIAAAAAEELAVCLPIVQRAESRADLEASALIVELIKAPHRGAYVRALCKQYGDQHVPTLKVVKSLLAGLEPLAALHEAAPSTQAASHDEALLRRWARSFPLLAPSYLAIADRIGKARAPYTERHKREHAESEQTALAQRFVKEHIVANGKIILLVGGSYAKGIIDAFNEFHPPVPTWGDWIMKERLQPLKSGEVDEAVASPNCAGVVIILKPAGHMITEQAKTAAQRHKKPFVSINNSSKSALRDGLRSLLVNMARMVEQDNRKVRQ